MKIVVVSGGFDPIHSGHIKLLEAATNFGDTLIVGLNSDEWLARKKGKPFMPLKERKAILEALEVVDRVYEFDDDDDTAINLLEKVKHLKDPLAQVVFANGGDRTKDNIPEMSVEDVEFVFGVGGEDKKNSSSWIIEEALDNKVETRWGYYRVLDEHPKNATPVTSKTKELVVKPGGCLSWQRHQHRNEEWFVKSGVGKCLYQPHDDYKEPTQVRLLRAGDLVHNRIHIPKMAWHQLINDSKTEDLRIIEIQWGEKCVEDDIENE